jgi:hypothetical protein
MDTVVCSHDMSTMLWHCLFVLSFSVCRVGVPVPVSLYALPPGVRVVLSGRQAGTARAQAGDGLRLGLTSLHAPPRPVKAVKAAARYSRPLSLGTDRRLFSVTTVPPLPAHHFTLYLA